MGPRTLILAICTAFLFSCKSTQPASGVRIQWGTTGLEVPVALPISGDMLATPISAEELKDTRKRLLADTTSGRARTRVSTDGRGGIEVISECLPDTVRETITVEVPVPTSIEADCPPPNRELIKAARKQGRSEGVALLLLSIILLFILRHYGRSILLYLKTLKP